MKPLFVVAVEHSKCDQYDKTTYFVVPEGRDEEQVRADVRAAQAAYFAALADFEKRYPEPSAWIEWVDQYEDERNGITDAMTIADAKALKAAKFAASQEWRRSRDAAIGSFQTHMATLG